jgi:hypothetical protein
VGFLAGCQFRNPGAVGIHADVLRRQFERRLCVPGYWAGTGINHHRHKMYKLDVCSVFGILRLL